MRRLADAGVGVIVVSSELPELLAVCDRILVYAEGKQRAEFPIAEATEENLVRAATHYSDEGAA
jgi:ABC-type sugar transport system ATPase subunit